MPITECPFCHKEIPAMIKTCPFCKRRLNTYENSRNSNSYYKPGFSSERYSDNTRNTFRYSSDNTYRDSSRNTSGNTYRNSSRNTSGNTYRDSSRNTSGNTYRDSSRDTSDNTYRNSSRNTSGNTYRDSSRNTSRNTSNNLSRHENSDQRNYDRRNERIIQKQNTNSRPHNVKARQKIQSTFFKPPGRRLLGFKSGHPILMLFSIFYHMLVCTLLLYALSIVPDIMKNHNIFIYLGIVASSMFMLLIPTFLFSNNRIYKKLPAISKSKLKFLLILIFIYIPALIVFSLCCKYY